jgi:branched-chain amino acid transport system ATP-binding protein
MTALLEVSGLTKSFDQFTAVAGIDLSLPEGGITAVIGPNGAGKTTFINLLAGKMTPDRGRITFAGADVTRLPASARVRAGIARTFQVTNVFPRLTVEQNVAVPVLARAGQSQQPWRRLESDEGLRAQVRHLLEIVGLANRGTDDAAALSHGDRRLLEIALALACDPRLLLLDEPTAGMGAGERDRVLAQVRSLAARKSLTLLLIEHDMEVVFGLAGRIVVLHQGRLIADGAPQEIRADPHVREIYLGDATVAPLPARKDTEGAPPLLRVEHLDAGYALAHVLHDVSFTVARVEAVFPPLAKLWDRKGRHLSGGEQKMLAIARALTADPSLLLLDEPSEGLGPQIVRILAEALAQIRGEDVTVLLADQNLMFARAVADRALVMQGGRLVHAASRAELAGNDPALHRLLMV